MQELVGADKRRLRADRFEREADKARAQKLVTTAATERDTALAWLDRYYAEAIAAVIEEFESQARLEIQAAEGAYRAGRGSQSDIFIAQSAMAMFEDRASEARGKVRNAKSCWPAGLASAAEQAARRRAGDRADSLDPAMLEQQLVHHPQIAVLDQQVDVATAEAKLAQGEPGVRLDGRGGIPAARLVVLEHDLDRPFDSLAVGSEKPPGPRAGSEAGSDRAGAGSARRGVAHACRRDARDDQRMGKRT
jgi:outer membrane protein TolC